MSTVMIDALKQRVDPAGTKEVTIRRYGRGDRDHHPPRRPCRPGVHQATDHGPGAARVPHRRRPTLESKDRPIIEKAEKLSARAKKLGQANKPSVAKWVTVQTTGSSREDDSRLVRRTADGREGSARAARPATM